MDEFEAPQADTKTKNKAVLAVCIVGIVLGALGICTGGSGFLGGVVNLAFAGTMSDLTVAGLPPAQRLAYDEFMTASLLPNAMQTALSLVNLIASGLLIWGGVVGLQSKQKNISMMSTALAACIVHDVLKAGLAVFNFFWLGEALAKYMKSMTNMPGMPNMGLEGVTSASMGIGIVFTFIWVAICMAFYIWALMSLRGADQDEFN